MGYIVEYVVLELQELVGMMVGFGCIREIFILGIYNVVYEYVDEQVGCYVG